MWGHIYIKRNVSLWLSLKATHLSSGANDLCAVWMCDTNCNQYSILPWHTWRSTIYPNLPFTKSPSSHCRVHSSWHQLGVSLFSRHPKLETLTSYTLNNLPTVPSGLVFVLCLRHLINLGLREWVDMLLLRVEWRDGYEARGCRCGLNHRVYKLLLTRSFLEHTQHAHFVLWQWCRLGATYIISPVTAVSLFSLISILMTCTMIPVSMQIYLAAKTC